MSIPFTKAQFLRSASSAGDFPIDAGAEIAFCGRSNAGKSSAINALCNQNNLARTSKTPGRTQLINFFTLDGDTRLVDLPGYGYAKAPVNVQRHWHELMETYLVNRQVLYGLVLLMDIRHPLTEIDWKMIHWSQHYQLPLYVLLTKADKVKRGKMMQTVTKVAAQLEQEMPETAIQVFSATKKMGVSQAQNHLVNWLESALTEKTPR